MGREKKITKYFCGLEKQKQKNFVSKQMNKIIAKIGSILTQTNAISEETKQFYESLDKDRKTEDCKIEQLIKDYLKIAEEEAENLKGKITVEEATCALKRMKNGKSPGSDGFTVEFLSLLEEETRQSGGESNK